MSIFTDMYYIFTYYGWRNLNQLQVDAANQDPRTNHLVRIWSTNGYRQLRLLLA